LKAARHSTRKPKGNTPENHDLLALLNVLTDTNGLYGSGVDYLLEPSYQGRCDVGCSLVVICFLFFTIYVEKQKRILLQAE
jgi:hypothetical protein